MGDMHQEPCRTCGADGAGGAYACAHRERAHAEEVAAAEDFDPLRIRPYVTLREPAAAQKAAVEPQPDADRPTTVLPVVRPGAGSAPAAPASAPLPPAREVTADADGGGAGVRATDARPARSRRPLLLAAAVAVLAVLGVAGAVGGVFTPESDAAEQTAAAAAGPSADDAASGGAGPSASASGSASASP
ncbi:hypothetical protein ACFWEG_11885, partial [Streptomyces sp. NPDC060194]